MLSKVLSPHKRAPQVVETVAFHPSDAEEEYPCTPRASKASKASKGALPTQQPKLRIEMPPGASKVGSS